MKSRTAGDAAVLVYTVLGQLTELKDGLSSSVGQLHQLTMAAALAIVVVEVLSLGADGRRFETATDRWSRFLNIFYAVSQALQAKLFFSPNGMDTVKQPSGAHVTAHPHAWSFWR